MIYNYKTFRNIIAILILFSLSNCSKKTDLDENQVFRYNEHSNISSLDPAFSSTLRNIWPVNQLFNGLVRLDEDLNIVPDLAESWTISKDGLNYNFNIKNEVYF